MDTQRLILVIIFAFSLFMLWEAWQREHRPQPPVAQPTAPAGTAEEGAKGAAPPPTPAASSKVTMPAPGAATGAPVGAASERGDLIRVQTDVMNAEVSTIGGDIVRIELLKQKDTTDKSKNYVLLGPEYRYVAQSGLIGDDLPNHKTLFRAAAKEYVLGPASDGGKDSIDVRLEATSPSGVRVAKVLTFKRGSYVIDITEEVTNESGAPLETHAYFQLTRDDKSPPGDNYMLHTFTGAAVYTEQDKYVKVSFSDIEKGKTPFTKNADNGWIAMVQHYFVSALIPPAKALREYYTRRLGEGYFSAGVILPIGPVPPGGTAKVTVPLYSGPQDVEKLEQLAPGLNLVVDYGLLTILAAPIFWLLQWIHRLVGNWGIAIILLTVLIKAIFYPLSAASYKSMAKMKQVAPRLTKLREQFGGDRAKLNQAMMELYKEERINPLGGCLPIVVQIPVFIALYWVLLGSVELRHAPFYGWIQDLSAPDPFYVLPALMMVSMVVQTKLNPTPPDPVQAKVMMIMPFAFGVMFFFFPAGLVLYWLVNNILSIAQQWQITRTLGGGNGKKTAEAKG